jgi:hypothetical protein
MRRSAMGVWLSLWLWSAGCSSVPAMVDNPTPVGNPNYDLVWDSTVFVLEKYFDVASESRWDGRIETLPLSSATLLEPWRLDAPGFGQRLEATLQTIRRRAFVLIQPAPTGGFLITVEVYKELEDLPQPTATRYGAASFFTSIEPIPESPVTSAIKPTQGWISLGRDLKLEGIMLAEIQKAVDGGVAVSGPAPSPPPPVNAGPPPTPTP